MDFEINANTLFQTARHEFISLDDMVERIRQFVESDSNYKYRLSVGTDSMTYGDTFFVLAIVLHRVGNGGIYFYKKFTHPSINNLREKLYKETQLSIDAIELLLSKLIEKNIQNLQLSIHLDIGENGPSKDLIRELEGWVSALGYDYAIKPDSYAASTIANKYSK